jgi:hypothetical protein
LIRSEYERPLLAPNGPSRCDTGGRFGSRLCKNVVLEGSRV